MAICQVDGRRWSTLEGVALHEELTEASEPVLALLELLRLFDLTTRVELPCFDDTRFHGSDIRIPDIDVDGSSPHTRGAPVGA